MENTPIGIAFRSLLSELRDELNAKFHTSARLGAKIDASEFQGHVQLMIGPIVNAIHLVYPERIRIATVELYDVSLELFKAKQIGADSKSLLMDRLWRSVLPRLGSPISRDPRRVVGSLCNGLLFAEQQGMAIGQKWLDQIETVGVEATSAEQLLAIGKFAAWTSGLPQYRKSALLMGQSLPWGTVGKMMGFSGDYSQNGVEVCMKRFEANPWTPVESKAERSLNSNDAPVELAKKCCGFRGFGGDFLAPPRVSECDGQLIVTDQQRAWILYADRFGAALERIDIDPGVPEQASRSSNPFVDVNGTIDWGGSRVRNAILKSPTSFAFDGRTLAVTIATSFHVFLFARPSLHESVT